MTSDSLDGKASVSFRASAKLLNKKQAATYLGIHARTLDRERDRGRLKWVQLGGQVRFWPTQLDEYLDQQTKGGGQ